MSENPYEVTGNEDDKFQEDFTSVTQAQATYNVVTDTVTGVNLRWSDNRFQAIFVLISVAVIALLGAILAALNSGWNLPWYGGALVGSFVGLVFGILGSGVILMLYRAARHIKGKHD